MTITARCADCPSTFAVRYSVAWDVPLCAVCFVRRRDAHTTATRLATARVATLRDGLRPYRLPGGRIVQLHADVARGAFLVSFTLENGTVVDATRAPAGTAVGFVRL